MCRLPVLLYNVKSIFYLQHTCTWSSIIYKLLHINYGIIIVNIVVTYNIIYVIMCIVLIIHTYCIYLTLI